MGNLSLQKLSKSMKLSVFSFDLRFTIIVGLALHWTWIWVVFWSSTFYSSSPVLSSATSNFAPVEPLWLLSCATNVLGFAVLFFSSKKHPTFGRNAIVPLLAGITTSMATLLVSYPAAATFSDPASYTYIIGALLTGFGSAVGLILWAELLAILGARQAIVYSVLATLAGSALYLLVSFLPDQVTRFLTAVLPAVEMWLFTRNQDVARNVRAFEKDRAPLTNEDPKMPTEPAEQSTPAPTPHSTSSAPTVDQHKPANSTMRKAYLEIAGISLFFGLSYGIMKGFFVLSSEYLITVRDYLNIGALILGAIAILVTTSVFRMDFRHMTYQIALPLMAAGFIFFALTYPFDLVGFATHQMGYQYFYIIIWALWAILTRKLNVPVTRIACVSMMAIMSGQLIGSIVGAQLISLAADKYTIAVIAACSVFVILLVALFAFESPFPGSDWGIFHPLMQDESAPKFKRSLEILAEMRGLSPREKQVFELLAKGRNSNFISTQLVISEATAKTHVKRIYRKFGVHSQQALLDMIELDGKCH